MILQALVRHYEQLAAKGRLETPGWQSAKVSYALRLNESGELRAIEDLREETVRGKKTWYVMGFVCHLPLTTVRFFFMNLKKNATR